MPASSDETSVSSVTWPSDGAKPRLVQQAIGVSLGKFGNIASIEARPRSWMKTVISSSVTSHSIRIRSIVPARSWALIELVTASETAVEIFDAFDRDIGRSSAAAATTTRTKDEVRSSGISVAIDPGPTTSGSAGARAHAAATAIEIGVDRNTRSRSHLEYRTLAHQ